MKQFAKWSVKAIIVVGSVAVASNAMKRFEHKMLANVAPRDWRKR